ncbi:MAG: YbaB/EbfC family nucleoid-associated protein [Deltaproteobacteria bacterium]|nr:YbaB/EbfC family nucleoid-associated protein [Deltaproteobacteria bacterium]
MAKGLSGMLKQAQKMQEQMTKLQDEAAKKTTEATSGGGMVTAVVNGKQQLLSLKLEEDVVDPSDIEMLQDLIIAAVNEAMKRSQEEVAAEMSKLAGGMKIPGLF